MRHRFLLAVTIALLSVACVAQAVETVPSAAPMVAATPQPATVRVTLKTSLGDIVLELEAERAPVTTKNFLAYVDQHRFDGSNFYRAMKNGATAGLIQGDAGFRDLKPIAHEPTSQTGLTHTDGTISLARREPGTATSDFFICIGDNTYLDAGREGTGDKLGFAAFGHVVEGMDVARAILNAPVSATKGEGNMVGQMLEPPVTIVTARRVKP